MGITYLDNKPHVRYLDGKDSKNKIPNTENFLSQIIQNSRIGPFGGTSITAALPSNSQEVMDLPSIIGRQIPGTRGQDVNIATMGPSAIGLNIAGINKTKDLISPPQTPYGRNMEMSADIAPLAALGLGGATELGNSLKRGNLPQEIKSIEGELGTRQAESDRLGNVGDYLKKRGTRETGRIKESQQALKKGFETNAERLAHESGGIKTKADLEYTMAKQNYRNMIQNTHPENVDLTDLKGTLDKVIEEKGLLGREFLRPEEAKLLNIRNEIDSRIPKPSPDVIDPITNLPEPKLPVKEAPQISSIMDVKQFKNKIFNSFGGESDLEGSFMNHYGNMLKEKGLTEYQKANEVYTKAMENFKTSKLISRGTVKKSAMGKMVPEEASKLAGEESKLGTNYINKGQELSSKYKADQAGLSNKASQVSNKYSSSQKELGSKQGDLNQHIQDLQDIHEYLGNELQKMIGRQRFTKSIARKALIGTTAGATGYGGYRIAKSILNIFGDQNQ